MVCTHCAALLRADKDEDGVINASEYDTVFGPDKGTYTQAELEAIHYCFLRGSIEEYCPGCYGEVVGAAVEEVVGAAVGAQACYSTLGPSRDKSVKVDDRIRPHLSIRNCGTEAGTFAFLIYRDGVTIASAVGIYLGQYDKSSEIEESFLMPDKTIVLTFVGKHQDEKGNYVTDFSHDVTITPIVGECDQGFLVQNDETKEVIQGASISALGKTCVTDSTGQCVIKLTNGVTFAATIVKDGYEVIVTDVYTACTYPIPVKLRKKAAKGEITLCNINHISCPNNGEANPGDKIPVTAEMENVGTEKGKFMFYVLDQHGNELSKAGGIGYKDVKAGETWKVTPESWDDLDFKMPNESIIKGHLELRRLE